jgi:hypothetical protein
MPPWERAAYLARTFGLGGAATTPPSREPCHVKREGLMTRLHQMTRMRSCLPSRRTITRVR